MAARADPRNSDPPQYAVEAFRGFHRKVLNVPQSREKETLRNFAYFAVKTPVHLEIRIAHAKLVTIVNSLAA